MEIDHELSNKELAVRILGLLHAIRLIEEFEDWAIEYELDLKHAAFALCERLVLGSDV